MQKFLAAMLSLLTTAICFPQPRLNAAHATPLFHATREYRDATQYLSRALCYQATLDPTQKMFLKRLVHSSHQLYAATLSCPLNATGTLGTAFRLTWAPIQTMVEDLPWMLEALPPEVKQRVTPLCRQFLLTYQTLAFQIALRDPVCATPRGGRPASIPVDNTRQLMIYPTELAPFPHSQSDFQTRNYYWPGVTQTDHTIIASIFRSRQILSPSEWQLQQAETQDRSKTPIRSGNSQTSAKLTRARHRR